MALPEDERLRYSDPEDILAKVRAEVSKFRVAQAGGFVVSSEQHVVARWYVPTNG